MQNSTECPKGIWGGVATTVLRLAVLALAIFAVTSWDRASGRAQRVAIAPADDAVANGLKILDQAPTVITPAPTPAGVAGTEAPAKVLLRNWSYTKGSGGTTKG